MRKSVLTLRKDSRALWGELSKVLLALALGGAIVYLLLTGYGRMALALTLSGLFVGVATVNIRLAIPVVFVYLIFLGDLRRLLIPYFGWSGTDPLLLAGGFFTVLITGFALADGTLKFDTKAMKWAVALIAVMVLQIFNPKQGGLMVGIAGAMFMIVPMLWFWVGRAYATPSLMRVMLYKIVLPLGVVAAAYGTYQVFYGYLPHQQMWLDTNWYAGLGPPDNPSPISLFSSNTEYGTFVSIALVVAWAAFLKGHHAALLFVPIFISALALTGVRGPLFFSVVMMAGLWAVLSRSKAVWLVRGAVALVLAAVGLAWGVSQATKIEMGAHVEGRIDRQAQQFAPSAASSTRHGDSAGNHFGMMLWGYTFAVTDPLGHGLGSTTKAAGKFGGQGFSTETPFGNSIVALGLPGGIAYHVVVFLIIVSSFQYWIRKRSLLALALMGVLGVTMANLMAGGMYAVGPLIAFCAGALDRLANVPTEKVIDRN